MGGFCRGLWIAVGCALVCGTAGTAHAFCGFYVSDSEAELSNDASFVVLLRDGTRTVMTMRNDYVGPPSDFALVVPLPSSIDENDVHVIDDETLDRVERFTSPRLVEYFDEDPCRVLELRKFSQLRSLGYLAKDSAESGETSYFLRLLLISAVLRVKVTNFFYFLSSGTLTVAQKAFYYKDP